MTALEDPGLDSPEGLVDLVYDSMLDEAALPRLLESTARAVGADSAHLLALCPLNRRGFWVGHNIDPAAVDAYEQYYAQIDPWRAALPEIAPGRFSVARGEDLVCEQTLLRSEFYNDFLLGLNQQKILFVQVRPEAPRAPTYAFSVFRGPGRERFDPRADAVLGELGRHLLRVERLGTAALLAGSDMRGDAAFFLAAGGRLVQCNPAAEALIADRIVVPGVRTISFGSQALDLWFHGLVASPRRLCDHTRHRTNARIAGHGEFEFELTALRGRGPTPVLRVAPMVLRARRAVRQPGDDGFARDAFRRYALTASEIDVLRRLAAGATVTDIAAARTSSPETVRSHLKSAKRKTGVGRQVDLVRLVLRMSDGPGGAHAS